MSIGAETVNLDITSQSQGKELEVTITPANATTDVDYSGNNDKVFTVEKIANNKVKVTPVSVGEGTLTAKTDNGLTDSATVKVTQS